MFDQSAESRRLRHQTPLCWVTAPFWVKNLSFLVKWDHFIFPASLASKDKRLRGSLKYHFHPFQSSQNFSSLIPQSRLLLFKLFFGCDYSFSPISPSPFKNYGLPSMLGPEYADWINECPWLAWWYCHQKLMNSISPKLTGED